MPPKWEDINTKLIVVVQHGKTFTKRVPRPWEAMPLWFKRWVKGLNEHNHLQDNLALRKKYKTGSAHQRRTLRRASAV